MTKRITIIVLSLMLATSFTGIFSIIPTIADPINQPPILTNENPANNSMNVNINTPLLSIIIQDPEGHPVNWTIITSPNIGSSSGNNESNGTKNCNISNPAYAIQYNWTISAYDGQSWTNKTFTFRTIPNPIIPTLKWFISSESNESRVAPAVDDINNDVYMEIIRSGDNGIVVYNRNYGVVWKKILPMWSSHIPLEVIDLNKDGYLDVICSYKIIATNKTGTMALNGNDGSTLWQNPDAQLADKHPVAGDIDADGYPEIYVCINGEQNGSSMGSVTALYHNGTIFAQTPTYYPCWGGLSLGDTDFDGIFELYLCERNVGFEGNTVGKGVRAFWASNLTERWNQPEMLVSSHCPTLVDTNKDGILDVVVLHQRTGPTVFNSADGSVIHNITDRIPGLKAHSQPTVHDIDHDGNLEIIFGGGSDSWSKPIIWDLYNWTLKAWLPFDCWEPPAIADLDGDGYVEIIQCTIDNISFFDHNYTFIGSIPLPNNNTGPNSSRYDGFYGMSMIIAQDIDNDGLVELILNRGIRLYTYNTIGPAPTPRALSQFNYYSQLRGRSPYYAPFVPLAPLVFNENPADEAINIPYNPQISVSVHDYQGDLMTITFQTNASTGIWHTIKVYSNKHEGTYTADIPGINAPHTYYWWSVTVTDSTAQTTTKIYKFKTLDTILLSNIKPADLAKNVQLNPVLEIHAEQTNGFPMTIRFLTNASGNWTIIGTNTSVNNGTYRQKPTTMTSYNKKYYWSVHCYDQQSWTNVTYRFTTRSNSGGGGSSGGGSQGGEEPPTEPPNKKPIANLSAGEPYQGYVNTPLLFNGSKSQDTDGNITKWFWTFGDYTNETGEIILHTYSNVGTYTVNLTVTDNKGATHTDTTTCVITQPNRPPSEPIITGLTNGTTNTSYIFTVVSTDADNDTIHYSIRWGDETSYENWSGPLSSGTPFNFSHSWTNPGQYTIIVTVSDNLTTSSAEMTINIEEQPSTPGFEIIFVLCAITISLLLWRKKRIQ